jgi:hypothetical protein
VVVSIRNPELTSTYESVKLLKQGHTLFTTGRE